MGSSRSPTNGTALAKRREIALGVYAAAAKYPEVTAVYVFGSVASGQADETSDVDITLVCRSSILPVSSRKQLLSLVGSGVESGWKFDDPTLDNPLWEAVDVGTISGIPVEVHYQTAPAVAELLDQVINHGAITTHKVPFRPYTMAALIQRAWLLKDTDGVFHKWHEQIATYPKLLKTNILRHFIPILQDNLAGLQSQAERRLGPLGYHYFLFRCGDALTSILYAVNEIYDPADRRAERTVLADLNLVPRDFTARLNHIMEGPFDETGAMERAVKFEKLAGEVVAMAGSQP